MSIIDEHYNEYIDHQQDIANANLCDTEPEYRYFTFEVIETRYEVDKRTYTYRINAECLENQTLADMVGNHLTSNEFFDFVDINGDVVKEDKDTIANEYHQLVGNVWEGV